MTRSTSSPSLAGGRLPPDDDTTRELIAGLTPELIGYRRVTVREMLATPVGSELALSGLQTTSEDLGGIGGLR